MGQARAGGGIARGCVDASVCRLPGLHGEPAQEREREKCVRV